METPSASSFLPAAARFLELEGHRAPDFSACLVLIPHHHAGQEFRRALRQQLTQPVLIPPRLVTMPQLAQTAELGSTPDAPSKRVAELHDFLGKTDLLPASGMWQAAQELGLLLEELDAALASLDSPAAQRVFNALGTNAYLGLEASIAQTVWKAMAQGAPGLNKTYGQRLIWLAARAQHPIYTLGLIGLSPQEEAFLQAWNAQHAVHQLPDPLPQQDRQALLTAAWQATTPPLAQRAAEFTATHQPTALQDQVAILAGHNLETAARLAEHVLLDWLQQGRRRIALVALDRLLARRLRALLERRNILVQDETGWAFSTSAVSHVLERWLSLAGGPVWHKDLLDLLKSPFVFQDMEAEREQAVHGLAQTLRRHGAPTELRGYQTLAQRENLSSISPMLERLQQAQRLFTPRRQSMAEWLRTLLTSLDLLGATPALAADTIGRQMLDLLIRLETEVSGLKQPFSLGDWRRWLFMHLEQATFTDASVESPLRLTHLAAAHHRDLDGVLILGAGAGHLPGNEHTSLFNDETRRQLGLPGREIRESTQQAMLLDLLCRTPKATFIWQAEADGDPTELSPWLVRLEAFVQAAWGTSLLRSTELPPQTTADGRTGFQAAAPRAAVTPARLSVSAWQSLVACPYQYFARHLLGLNEQDDVPEEMDKAEYGSLVHRILAQFHNAHPSLADMAAEHLETELKTMSASVFNTAEQRNFLATAWRQRWERHISDYVAWAQAHETTGWQFQSAETPLERNIVLNNGSTVRIYGRADRLDRKGEALAVLDYKTQPRQTLRAKLEPGGEDVQLATYAWLCEAAKAGFITVDDKKVELLATADDGDLPDLAQAEAQRIAETLSSLADGQPLPAHGAPGICAWCEMEGLCRRAHRPGTMP